MIPAQAVRELQTSPIQGRWVRQSGLSKPQRGRDDRYAHAPLASRPPRHQCLYLLEEGPYVFEVRILHRRELYVKIAAGLVDMVAVTTAAVSAQSDGCA